MKLRCVIDLQLFAGEKTEKATPKKRKDARDKGQVFKSQELSSAIILLTLFVVLRLSFPFMFEQLQNMFVRFMQVVPPYDEIYSLAGLNILGVEVFFWIGIISAPVVLFALVSGLAISYGQVGFLFTAEPLLPQLNRLNPMEGFKRMFSLRTFTELVKSLIKVALVSIISYQEYMTVTRNLPALLDKDVFQGATFIGESLFNLSIRVGIALLILSVLDYIYQWWEYEKNLKMSKQDIKDEYKQMEGDPQIRSKIKEKQRQLGLSRMMQQVPLADVIITNPTHYAVALKYEPGLNEAPVVMAKGADLVALRIRKVAEENKIAIVENPQLARVIFSTTEIGQMIPAEMFQAVAEVLAYVFSLREKGI